MNFDFEVRPGPFCPGVRFLIFLLGRTKPQSLDFVVCFGGDKRDRTADLLNAIQALSQLSYSTTSFQSSYEAVSCSGSNFSESDFTPSAKSLFCIPSA